MPPWTITLKIRSPNFPFGRLQTDVSVTSIDRDVTARFSLGEVQPVAEDAGTVRVEVVG